MDHIGSRIPERGTFVVAAGRSELAEALLGLATSSEMVTLADRIAVMNHFTPAGELTNTHEYEPMSQAVIRMIHT